MSDQDQEINTEKNGENEEKSETKLDKNEDSCVKDKDSVKNGGKSSDNEGECNETGAGDQDNGDTEPPRVFSLPEKAPKNFKIIVNPEEEALEKINKEILEDPDYAEVEDLTEHLEAFKKKFLEFDKDANGNIDLFGLSRMMEKLGQAKTHLEMKKMIREIDTTNTGSICYRDFITMMIGPKTSVLKLILLFEEKMKEKERPTGVAPKRDLASLP